MVMKELVTLFAELIVHMFKLLFVGLILAAAVSLGLHMSGVKAGFVGVYLLSLVVLVLKDRTATVIHNNLLAEMIKLHNSKDQRAKMVTK